MCAKQDATPGYASRTWFTPVKEGAWEMISGVRRVNGDDEIHAIDGVRVRADGLAARLEQFRPGDRVQMLVARRDRLTPLEVTLGVDPGRPWQLSSARTLRRSRRPTS